MASETTLKSTYMDDSMDSVQNDTQGLQLYQQLSTMGGSWMLPLNAHQF